MRKFHVLLHLLFWVPYLGLNIFINKMQLPPENFFFLEQLLKYLSPVLIFYFVAFFALPYAKKNITVLVVLFLFSLGVHYALSYCMLQYILPNISSYTSEGFYPGRHFFISGFWWWFHFSLYGFGYWYLVNSLGMERKLHLAETVQLNTEKENLQLKGENLELQNQKLTAEYNYLKSQINPHFLYNTLNYFYAETMLHSPKAAKGIALLSQIMRYSLQPAEADGKVPLADEVLHLNNYLDLQRMRFDDDLRLDCSLPVNIQPGYRILPHLLLTLAENAFKHGEAGTLILINLEMKGDDMVYIVSNMVKAYTRGTNTGVGLQNMQNRLAIYYGNNARLDFIKENGTFNAKLEIKNITMPGTI